MKRKFISLLLILVLALGIFTACAGETTPGKTEGDGGPDAEQYFNYALVADPTSFDSAKATDSTAIYMLIDLMEPLLRLEVQKDGGLDMAYAGAEEFQVSEDGLVWTFKLRENYWSDGQRVTADDYVYGVQRVLDPDTAAPYSYILMPILNAYSVNMGEMPVEELGIKAVDDDTLEISLEYETSYFDMLLYHTTMMPVRKDIVEKYGEQYGTEVDRAVYCGPFVPEEWVHNSKVVLVPNEKYWDRETVKLDKITAEIIQDENALYSSLENGSIDYTSASSQEWIDTFEKFDNLNSLQVSTSNVFYQYFNQYDELFSNVNIRKAFILGIDREDLNEVIYSGKNKPAYSIVPDGVYVGNKEYLDQVEAPVTKLIKEGHDPRELFIQGLTELGLDPDPAKHTVVLSFGGDDQSTKILAEYMQQTYQKSIGCQIEIKLQDWGAFSSDWYNYEYQVGQMAFGADFNDPLSMLSPVDSSMDGFVIGWGDEEVDELLYASYGEMDVDKRIQLIADLDDIFEYRDACVSPLTYNETEYFVHNYVRELPLEPFQTQGFKYTYTEGR